MTASDAAQPQLVPAKAARPQLMTSKAARHWGIRITALLVFLLLW